jgi:putative ABC transport system substrate-binding protein
MGKKAIAALLVGLALVSVHLAEAQQQAKVAKIGWLGVSSSSRQAPSTELFQRELRKLGYVEGKNLAIEYRSAENKLDRLPALVDELVRLNVDVLVTGSTAATLAAKTLSGRSPSCF